MNKLTKIAVLLLCTSAVFGGELLTFNDNGAWCWYQDERVIVHDNKLIMGSVANGSGTGGSSRNGNIEVVTYDLVSGGTPSLFVLHANLQADDHDLPGFLALPDGKILAMYTKHISDSYIRYRITTNPNDTSVWDAEKLLTRGAGTSYSNIFQLSGEGGRIYDFYRGENFNPNYVISDDNGQSWSYGGHLIRKDEHRPYVKYASNNVDKIHFITTEAHPRDYNNSVYHGYIYNGGIYKSDGTKLQNLSDGPVAPESLTKIHNGSASSVGWTTDIHLDSEDNPVVAFTSQVDGVGLDHRYFYGRWVDGQWHINEMCYGGSKLYSGEDDYTGLIAIDPQDVTTVYISVNVNPYTGAELVSTADNQRHWEIFRGHTEDYGASWEWKPITFNSTEDNIRPIVPIWDGDYTILLWNKGTYYTYTNYNMDVVGMFDPQPVSEGMPLITSSPKSAAVKWGATAKFSVGVSSDLPVSYAWYRNVEENPVPVGEDSNILEITNVGSGDVGEYYCIISNPEGSVSTITVSLAIAEMYGRWKLENDYQDSSGNGIVAIANGNPEFSDDSAIGDYSVELDGNDYLDCGTDSRFALSGSGTVCSWVKASSLSNDWASIVGKGRNAWRLCRYGSESRAAFHINTEAGEVQANGAVNILDGQWHHIAGTWSGQVLSLYIDGVLDGSASTSAKVSVTADPVWIGGRSDSSSRFWNGLIDDVRIYSYALTAEELAAVMAGTGCESYPSADFNRDCIVNLVDMAMLSSAWLECNRVPAERCE